jgi:hypothetical protein
MIYHNNEYYEGEWLNGMKHGEGIYKTNRKKIQGIWKNGQLVEEN